MQMQKSSWLQTVNLSLTKLGVNKLRRQRVKIKNINFKGGWPELLSAVLLPDSIYYAYSDLLLIDVLKSDKWDDDAVVVQGLLYFAKRNEMNTKSVRESKEMSYISEQCFRKMQLFEFAYPALN